MDRQSAHRGHQVFPEALYSLLHRLQTEVLGTQAPATCSATDWADQS